MVVADGTPASVVVRVSPGASVTDVRLPNAGQAGMGVELVVRVTSPAVDGRANQAVCACLAVWVGCRPNRVRIRRGHTGRVKRVEFLDLSGDDLRERIVELSGG